MGVQNVSNTPPLQLTSGVSSGNQISKDDFLKLLITQLQNQDPLNPMDNQQFSTQLATFNMLDQLIGINGTLASMQTSQTLGSQIGAVSLLGKAITANGNNVILNGSGSAPVAYNLGGNAARTVIQIKDSSGNLLRSIESDNQNSGDQQILWDGKDNSGNQVSPGVYTFGVTALDSNGNPVSVTTRIQGTVTAVNLTGAAPSVSIGSLQVPLSELISVQ